MGTKRVSKAQRAELERPPKSRTRSLEPMRTRGFRRRRSFRYVGRCAWAGRSPRAKQTDRPRRRLTTTPDPVPSPRVGMADPVHSPRAGVVVVRYQASRRHNARRPLKSTRMIGGSEVLATTSTMANPNLTRGGRQPGGGSNDSGRMVLRHDEGGGSWRRRKRRLLSSSSGHQANQQATSKPSCWVRLPPPGPAGRTKCWAPKGTSPAGRTRSGGATTARW